jgi:hypothetical protein
MSIRPVTPGMPTWQRLLAWAGVLIALGLVTLSYFQPEMIVDLSNRFWSCF